MIKPASTQKFQFLPFIICLAIPLAIGVTASYFTTPEIPGWYAGLKKPSFNPPNWLFAPVWTILYIMMGVASYLVWAKRDTKQTYYNARSMYVMSLVANFGWSFVFFSQHNLFGGLAILFFLLIFIISSIVYFKKFSNTAMWLMVPYLVWVCFAALLNYSIFTLN
ncbi:MAG: tryptophan-rich sensory protein [Sphingobacteriales bacterium]|nr:MAG: tryptophan-rich sensory protein [Sphingobacteriales bacterium]